MRALLAAALLSLLAAQTTFVVDALGGAGTYPTLQAALQAATHGDVISVLPTGVYDFGLTTNLGVTILGAGSCPESRLAAGEQRAPRGGGSATGRSRCTGVPIRMGTRILPPVVDDTHPRVRAKVNEIFAAMSPGERFAAMAAMTDFVRNQSMAAIGAAMPNGVHASHPLSARASCWLTCWPSPRATRGGNRLDRHPRGALSKVRAEL